jgi:hypothetical protein
MNPAGGSAAKMLTRDEARRIAANIAELAVRPRRAIRSINARLASGMLFGITASPHPLPTPPRRAFRARDRRIAAATCARRFTGSRYLYVSPVAAEHLTVISDKSARPLPVRPGPGRQTDHAATRITANLKSTGHKKSQGTGERQPHSEVGGGVDPALRFH